MNNFSRLSDPEKMFTNANIPNAEIIRVPMDEKGKTKSMAYVTAGVDVKDVLNQVKGLSQDGQRLIIFESKPPVLGNAVVIVLEVATLVALPLVMPALRL